MDRAPVTVAAFRRFVRDTGHRTVAEREPTPRATRASSRTLLVPGSLVFRPHRRAGRPARRAGLVGATSRARDGTARRARAATPTRATGIRSPTSRSRTPSPTRRGRARRCRPRPSGSCAARGGLEGATLRVGRRARRAAATWRTGGRASSRGRTCARRLAGTSPVGSFPANGFGLLRRVRQRLGVDGRRRPAGAGAGCAPRTRAARPSGSPPSSSRATSSRAARTCARRATACASGPRRASSRPSTPPRATSASAASSGPEPPGARPPPAARASRWCAHPAPDRRAPLSARAAQARRLRRVALHPHPVPLTRCTRAPAGQPPRRRPCGRPRRLLGRPRAVAHADGPRPLARPPRASRADRAAPRPPAGARPAQRRQDLRLLRRELLVGEDALVAGAPRAP